MLHSNYWLVFVLSVGITQALCFVSGSINLLTAQDNSVKAAMSAFLFDN